MDADFKSELEARRAKIVALLQADHRSHPSKMGSALLLFSAPVYIRNGDVEHSYRQHSDFYYLTGFEEPDCALLITSDEPGFVLFVRKRDREREIWDGRRAGVEGAQAEYGAVSAHPIDELKSKLPDYLEDRARLFYHFGEQRAWDEQVFGAVSAVRSRRRKRVNAPTELVDARELLHEARLIKTDYEQARMAEAGRLSAAGHRAAMAACRPGMTEWDLQTVVETSFRNAGARRVAYDSIVGSGENATILHYRENNRTMEAGDLVLIDAGAEHSYLSADITRTFPVDGKFSPVSRRLYEIVLGAQEASLAATKVGATLDEIHDASVAALTQGLKGEGLIDPQADEATSAERLKRFYMHRTSHYLGMDVHDVGDYHRDGELRKLEAGMVITIEPGLYIAPDDDTVGEEYRGIGIRIEDDVLITAEGIVNFTASAPKTVEEIESACRGDA